MARAASTTISAAASRAIPLDARWLVPHFEKMLYDNAELIELLTLVWQETRDAALRARVAETIGWLLREMIAGRRRLRQQPRRRQRGRGRQVLRLVRSRDRCGARARSRRAVQARLRRHRRRQLGRQDHPQPQPRSPSSPTRRPRRSWPQVARILFERRGSAGCGPAGTTRCWPTGTG